MVLGGGRCPYIRGAYVEIHLSLHEHLRTKNSFSPRNIFSPKKNPKSLRIAHRRDYGLSTFRLFTESLRSPRCGCPLREKRAFYYGSKPPWIPFRSTRPPPALTPPPV